METKIRRIAVWTVVTMLLLGPGAPPEDDAAERIDSPTDSAAPPLVFEENRGQTDSAVRFVARGPEYTVFLADDEIVYVPRGSAGPAPVFRERIVGSGPEQTIRGEAPLPGRVSYLRGSEPSRWVHGAPTFGRVRYICRRLLGVPAEPSETVSHETWEQLLLRVTGKDVTCCPRCGRGHLHTIRRIQPATDGIPIEERAASP